MHCCVYQLIVVGGGEVRVSIGNQQQLAIGVDREETQDVVLSTSYKVGNGLRLRLRHRLGPAIDVRRAVE